MAPSDSIILARKLQFSFGEGELRKQILFDVDFTVQAGEIVLLTGPSGSGKTTLLTLVGALRTVREGFLQVLGEDLQNADSETQVRVRQQIGFIFQSHNLLNHLTARENVQLSLELQSHVSCTEGRQRASELLESVGLGKRIDYYPAKLSGGQKQRVAIARALVGRPKLILADEPTAALDGQTGRDVVNLVQKLAREQQIPILLVTHDNRILDIADRIIHMEDGRIVSDQPMFAMTAS